MTLVEVMIVAGVGMIIALGLAQTTIQQAKTTQYLYDKIQYMTTIGNIEVHLKSPAACGRTLGSLVVPPQIAPGATPNQAQMLNIPQIVDRNGNSVLSSNGWIRGLSGTDDLIVDQMYLVNLTVNGPNTSGEIEIRIPVRRSKKGGGPEVFPEHVFTTSVSVNAASEITGCFDPGSLSAILDTAQRFEVTACHRNGRHTVVSACPAQWSLLACIGGPGDQFETMEGWYILPDFVNDECELHINEPACVGGAPMTYQRSIAICYRSG